MPLPAVAGGLVTIGMDLAGVTQGLATLKNKLAAFARNVAQKLKSVVMAPSKLADRLAEAAGRISVVLGGISAMFAMAGREAMRAADKFEKAMNRFWVAFRDQGAGMSVWGEQFAQAMNISRTAMAGMLAQVQSFLVPITISRDRAAALSQSMVALATDLASVTGESVEQALRAIQSGMMGAAAAVTQYGADVSDAAVHQYLLERGFRDGARGVDANVLAMARLNIMFRDTMGLQGHAAATTDRWGSSMRGLRAQLSNLWATLGRQLEPLLVPFIQKVTSVVRMVGDWVRSNPMLVDGLFKLGKAILIITTAAGTAVGAFAFLAAALSPLGVAVGYMIKLLEDLGYVNTGLAQIRTSLSGFLAPMKALLAGVWLKLKAMMKDVGATLIDSAGPFLQLLGDGLKAIWNWVRPLIPDIGKALLGSLLKVMGKMKVWTADLIDFIVKGMIKAGLALPRVMLQKLQDLLGGTRLGRWLGIDSAISAMQSAMSTWQRGAEAMVDWGPSNLLRDEGVGQQFLGMDLLNQVTANRTGFPDFMDMVRNLSGAWRRQAAGQNRAANQQIQNALDQLTGVLGAFTEHLPAPGAMGGNFPLGWGKPDDTKPVDSFGIWGHQSLANMMGFMSNDPQREQLRAQQQTNRLMQDLIDATRRNAPTPARYAQ